MKKKFGYTLAEVLIALGIIGFISAIMLPMINKVKPDSTKAMYLATYDAVVSATNEMASNINAYPVYDQDYNYPENITPDWDFGKVPLYNINEIEVGGVTYEGPNKYCKLLSISLNTIDDSNSCKDEYIGYTDDTFQNNISFTDTRGVQYLVTTEMDYSGYTNYRSEVYFDINGDDGNNCIYNSSTCKNPDRFKLLVAATGSVFEADEMGASYIKYRDDWTKKKPQPVTNEDLSLGDLEGLQPKYIGEPLITVNCLNLVDAGAENSCSGNVKIAYYFPEQSNYETAEAFCSSKGARIPNINELLSIKQASKDNSSIKENLKYDTAYWSSTTHWSSTTQNNAQLITRMDSAVTASSVMRSSKNSGLTRALCVK